MRRFRRIVAMTGAVPAGLVLAAVVSILVADYVGARRRQPMEKNRLEQLEQAARQDAAKVPLLVAEYERQTDESLRLRDRHRALTRVLIVAAVVFVTCAKWYVSLGGPTAPSLGQIERHRQATPAPARFGRWWLRRRRDGPARDGQPAVPELDLSFVDRVVAEEGRGQAAAIAILQRIQEHYRYLPDEALQRVCELTEIKPAQIAGVSSFYAQFRRGPVGRYIVKLCHGTACHVSGARQITEEVRRRLGIAADSDTDPQRRFTIEQVACLGCCSLAPVMMVEDQTFGKLTPASACEHLESYWRERVG